MMWKNIKFSCSRKATKLPRGFTLIELLVVISIVAVLATATILVINPAELIKQGRDSTRLSDLNNINRSLGFLQVDNPSASFGTANTVYVSIPDTSATCANLGLPTLPDGWAYSCATDANHRNTDSTGWIPADFTSFSAGSPLSVLPIDPINATSSSLYYTYVTGGSWEMTALFESVKRIDRAKNDGGVDITMYEVGSNLIISPFVRGLVGYWKFDEGSDIIANDSSGFGNHGTLSTGTSSVQWAGGKINTALNFDGDDDYITGNNIPNAGANADITIEAWVKLNSISWGTIFSKGQTGNCFNYGMLISSGALHSRNSGTDAVLGGGISLGNWNHLVIVYNNGGSTGYVNGQSVGSNSITTSSCGPLTWIIGVHDISVPNRDFNGIIDELKIYHRALTSEEIRIHYLTSAE